MNVRSLSLAFVVLLGAPLVTGCGEDEDEDLFGEPPEDEDASITPETVRSFAGLSAPAIFGAALVPYIMAGLEDADTTSTCPSVTVNGDTTVYEGGCLTENGNSMVGRASYTKSGNQGTLVYEGFGFASPAEGCAVSPSSLVYDGTLVIVEDPAGGGDFDIDVSLVVEAASPAPACEVYSDDGRIVYSGSVAGVPSAMGSSTLQHGTWNGSGTYSTGTLGKLHSETVDELLDQDICAYEAASGQTTLSAGNDVLVVTYDGAGDCDEQKTVRVQLNGKDLGEIADVACSFGLPSRSRTAAPFLFALGVYLIARRRRRSSS